MTYTIHLFHCTIGGLESGISTRNSLDFEGSLEDAKGHADRILFEAVGVKKLKSKWEAIGKTHIRLDDQVPGGFSVSVAPKEHNEELILQQGKQSEDPIERENPNSPM